MIRGSGNGVTKPQDVAREHGLREGSEVAWETTPDGQLVLRGLTSQLSEVRGLRGFLKPYLQPGEDGVESFLRWRNEERALEFAEEDSYALNAHPASDASEPDQTTRDR